MDDPLARSKLGTPVALEESVLRTQKGFTLIEVLVVVAIIGILSGLAVTFFGKEQSRAKVRGEVVGIFAEMKLRQEQHLLENNVYLSTSSAANTEAGAWPGTAPLSNGSKVTLFPLPASWSALGMASDHSATYCSYVAIIGDGGDATNVDIVATTFGYTPPGIDWYYLLAHCDMDQGGSVLDSYYFQASDDSELFYLNEGK